MSMTNDVIGETGEVGKPSVFGMIMNPREQFAKIRTNPISIIAILIVTGITFGSALILYYNFALPPELMEGLGEQEIQMIVTVGKITSIFVGLVGPIFGITLASLIYFLAAKIVKSSVSFKQMFSMFAHINIIGAIASIVNAIVFLFIPYLDPNIVITSLESIVEAGGILGAILNSIEIFSIWQLIVTAIGLQVVARFSKKAAWTTVIVIFLIGLTFSMISAGINSLSGF